VGRAERRKDGGEALNLRALALVSGLYDLVLGVTMLFFAREAAQLFGAPDPTPLLNAQLNGVFALSLAAGYFWAREDIVARRGYFWVAGVLAKALGALLFVVDHVTQGSPVSFLLFAATDGTLALLTLFLLLRPRS
jgi:hypothetical protein